MIIINNLLGRANLKLICGNVENIAEGTGLATGKVINLRLKDGTQVAFWNNETRQMANRLRKANVKVGSFISILVLMKDENKANAINFKYNGIWNFEDDNTSINPTMSGLVTNYNYGSDGVAITLDNGEMIVFKNEERGFQFENRFREKSIKIGTKVSILKNKSGKILNFAVNDKWEIQRSVSAIIGNVAFVDESVTPDGKPRVKVNVSIFDHKDRSTGNNIYRNVFIYFDNENNPNMVESVKKRMKRHMPIACVGKRNPKMMKETYTGYYFINL